MQELDSAECYAKAALMKKEEFPQVAQAYFQIANERMSDMGNLHKQVAAIIEDYHKTKGEPPEGMKMIYEILHRKHIQHAATVKGLLSLYKDM